MRALRSHSATTATLVCAQGEVYARGQGRTEGAAGQRVRTPSAVRHMALLALGLNGLTAATSAPELRSSLPHLHQHSGAHLVQYSPGRGNCT